MKSPPKDVSQRFLVLVTGPSGAGRSTAINVLEDLEQGGVTVALGLDVRHSVVDAVLDVWSVVMLQRLLLVLNAHHVIDVVVIDVFVRKAEFAFT